MQPRRNLLSATQTDVKGPPKQEGVSSASDVEIVRSIGKPFRSGPIVQRI